MVWNLVDVHINRYKYLYYRITLVSIDKYTNTVRDIHPNIRISQRHSLMGVIIVLGRIGVECGSVCVD